MPSIITNKFRINNSQEFYNSFSGVTPTSYYLGIGRPHPFTISTRGDGRTVNEGTDSSPPTPVDSIQDEFYIYDDLLSAKQIISSIISYVIPRILWSAGTVYDYYRSDYGNFITGTTTQITSNSGATNLYNANFYVLTSDYHVYKCLDNNNGAQSSVQPTGTSTNILTTADDYRWKYMYTLNASQQYNFLSTSFMAVVTNDDVKNNAILNPGQINVIKIKTPGTNGIIGTYTDIPIRGDGSLGTITVTISSGAITDIQITNTGTDYTFAYIKLSDINAAGAVNLIGAELDCIIEPKVGHGFDAITELGGFYVMLNVDFIGDEIANSGDFGTGNDFRKIVLIKNPYSNGVLASSSTLRATNAVRFIDTPTPGNFENDETITQLTTGATGKVIQWDSSNRILYYIQTRFVDEGIDSNGNKTPFSGVNIIEGSTSGATGIPSNVTEVVNNVSFTTGYSTSEMDANSGDIIYIDNRAPITRALDQVENIKLIMEF
jgi:hypothetical protein